MSTQWVLIGKIIWNLKEFFPHFCRTCTPRICPLTSRRGGGRDETPNPLIIFPVCVSIRWPKSYPVVTLKISTHWNILYYIGMNYILAFNKIGIAIYCINRLQTIDIKKACARTSQRRTHGQSLLLPPVISNYAPRTGIATISAAPLDTKTQPVEWPWLWNVHALLRTVITNKAVECVTHCITNKAVMCDVYPDKNLQYANECWMSFLQPRLTGSL